MVDPAAICFGGQTPPHTPGKPSRGGVRHSGSVDNPALTDDVIRLRALKPTDADWYAVAIRDELIQRFTSEAPDITSDDVRKAILNLRGQGNATGLLICDAVSGERLGNIALHHENGVGDVSYWLAATARGKGAATRALRLLSRWAFDRLGLDELRLWTHADNSASRRVAERAGFHRDPQRDQERQIKGGTWATIAYCLTRMSGMQVRVRKATAADAVALARLRGPWPTDGHGYAGADHATFVELFSAWFVEHLLTHLAFLAEVNDHVVGMAWLMVADRVPSPTRRRRRTGDVQPVYVVPELRDRGVGAALLDAVLGEARRLDLEHVTVHSSDRAVPFYQRKRFQHGQRWLQWRPE